MFSQGIKMTYKYQNRLDGFTLVELSIVIIIIGFLIAGIAAGNSLIKAAGISRAINEFTNYKTSIYIFNNKYGYLPGDLPNAAAFFGCTDDATPTGCNGNGDGQVTHGFSGVGEGNEILRAWQHLSLAGMINGSYPGITTVNNQFDIGINVPQSVYFSTKGFYIHTTPWGGFMPGDTTTLTLGGFLANDLNYDHSVSGKDAHNIDSKLDDGLPRTGNFYAVNQWNGSNNPCTTGLLSTSTYKFSDTISCIVGFNLEIN